MSKFIPTIGLELHVELKTKTKMFSNGPVSFGAEPNTKANVVDLGYPGTLPTVNQAAVASAIKTATALQMTIDSELHFDRKNYYYADLPKGYQITQQFRPIGKTGKLVVVVGNQLVPITIERLHIEEDTAKQIHGPDQTLLDYNRAGIPLIEIVTNPVITSAQQAVAFVSELRNLLIYADVSDAKMSEGSLRCDVNVSLRSSASAPLGVKVEIKNLNSLANIETAIAYEIKRQSELLANNQKVVQSTRRFDEATQTTILMRVKETAVDYKYFPEPNILPIMLNPTWIKAIQATVPELPLAKRQRYQTEYQLTAEQAAVISQDYQLVTLFEAAVNQTQAKVTLAKLLIGPVKGLINSLDPTNQEFKVSSAQLADLAQLVANKAVTSAQAQNLLVLMQATTDLPSVLIKARNMTKIDDPAIIQSIIDKVINQQPAALKDYQDRPQRVIKFMMGQVMAQTKGKADPKLASDLVVKALNKWLQTK